MLIRALILTVRVFTINLPININYNIHRVGHGNYCVEYNNGKDSAQVENLAGVQKFAVYPDRIAVDFEHGTLWLTKSGMEW
jgi:hypothetical protein